MALRPALFVGLHSARIGSRPYRRPANSGRVVVAAQSDAGITASVGLVGLLPRRRTLVRQCRVVRSTCDLAANGPNPELLCRRGPASTADESADGRGVGEGVGVRVRRTAGSGSGARLVGGCAARQAAGIHRPVPGGRGCEGADGLGADGPAGRRPGAGQHGHETAGGGGGVAGEGSQSVPAARVRPDLTLLIFS
jgi:hypothetical protein